MPRTTSKQKGDAAEQAVLGKLQNLGFHAKLTGTYHSPHDIEVATDGSPLLIQVKRAWWNTQRSAYRSQCKRTFRSAGRFIQAFYQPADFDVYVAWIEDRNVFYVLPFSAVEGHHALSFVEGRTSQRSASTAPYREAWHVITDAIAARNLDQRDAA